MSGHENDRGSDFLCQQTSLQLQATKATHPHIGDQTPHTRDGTLIQQSSRLFKLQGAQTNRVKEGTELVSKGCIAVDNGDIGLR
jgi:hypothetical protein